MPVELGSFPVLEAFSTIDPLVLPGSLATEDVLITGAALWVPGHAAADRQILRVVMGPPGLAGVRVAAEIAASPGTAWALCGWNDRDLQTVEAHGAWVAGTLTASDATSLIIAASRAGEAPHLTELRRLTGLQRSLSQALGAPDPLTGLMDRLQRLTNAVCVVVDSHGRVQKGTGTLPLRGLMEQIHSTPAPSQQIAIDGWFGLAVRLQGTDSSEQCGGWLIVAARREKFPDPPANAAVHIAATLTDTAQQLNRISLAQQAAVRAALLDEILTLNSRPESQELASRLAAFGLDFEAPMHVVVSTRSGGLRAPSRAQDLALQRRISQKLADADLPFISTPREFGAVHLVQTTPDTLHRFFKINGELITDACFGIGRRARNVGDIGRSFDDAQLAIRAIQAGRHPDLHMSFDQFNFATRVFASAGLDAMAQASREFLAPLTERPPLLEAVRQYFSHAQNTNAAASSLGIHHNTLRYRLNRLEELLDVSINEPSTISSLFLAITCLDMVDADERGPSHSSPVSNDRFLGVSRHPVVDEGRSISRVGGSVDNIGLR